jgi:hypothetical protein
MATGRALILPSQAFSQLPQQLANDIRGAFAEIVKNFAEGRWEPAELNGGKLCEAVYTACQGIATGRMPQAAAKPKDMVGACRTLEKQTSALRSVRVQIPRMLVALYEIRNSRNVGHVGGEVDPNHMDALCVLQMSKWIVAELVRILHQMPIDDAADLVETLVERDVPLVWKVGSKRRVLDSKMSMPNKTLLLLHGCTGAVAEADLLDWIEHSNASAYRRDVLRRAHKAKLLEYDDSAKTVMISPLGVKHVEEQLLKTAV